MPDNFNTGYLQTRQAREQPAFDKLIAEAEALSATQKAPPAEQAGPPAPKAEKPVSVMAEASKAVGGAVRDAGQAVFDLVDDAGTWLNNNLIDLRIGSGQFGETAKDKRPDTLAKTGAFINLPEMPKNETVVGEIARTVGQFVVPFLGATKALKAVSSIGWKARGMTAGAITDFSAFQPHDKTLSNMIMDFSDQNPAVGKPLFEYLSTNAADSNAENRFKRAVEGLGVGFALEGLIKGVKAVRGYYNAKGLNASEAVVKAAEEAKLDAGKVVKDATLPAHEQIDLLTGADRQLTAEQAAARRAQVGETFANSKAENLTASGNYDSIVPPKAQAMTPEEAADKILQRRGATELSTDIPAKQAGIDMPAAPAAKMDTASTLKLVEADVAKSGGRKLMFDPQRGALVFTREAQVAGQLDVETLAKGAMEKSPFERTAEDLISLRAYKQLQEAAFPGIIRVGEHDAVRAIEVVESAGSGERAITHKLRKQIREGTAPPVDAAADAGPKAGTKAARTEIAAGDTVFYGGGEHSGLVQSISKNGKVIIKDDVSGAVKAVTPDVADPLMASIKENTLAINKALGRKQGGAVSVPVLTQMLSAAGGGAAGYSSAESDASLSEKLSLAFGGALAGLGIHAGASKVLTSAERSAIAKPHSVAQSLSRPEMQGIAPLPAAALLKRPPVIKAEGINRLVEAAKRGGFKDLADAVTKEDFNFAHLDSENDISEVVNAFSNVFSKETNLAKHGTQTFDDMKEFAAEAGAGKQTMAALAQTTNNLGGTILGHRALMSASANHVNKLAAIAKTGDVDGILALRKQVAVHAVFQAQMAGIQTEVGRALAQFRITASTVDLIPHEVDQLIEAMGGHAANIKFARQLSSITNPTQLNAVTRQGAMARTQDALFEAYVNGMLWSPITHAVNLVSNSLAAIGSAAEFAAAAGIGAIRRKMPNAIQESISAGEVVAHTFGMAEGVKKALWISLEGRSAIKEAAGQAMQGDFGAAARTVRENQNEFGGVYQAWGRDAPVLDNAAFATKDASLQEHAFTAKGFDLDPKSFMGMVADGFGTFTRLSGRGLTTSDELFKTIHYQGSLHSQAYREARNAGLEGEAFATKVATLISDPTPIMRAQALSAAREGTFTAGLGPAAASIQRGINWIPGGRYIVPFFRTPVNLVKFAADKTPALNLLAKSNMTEFAAGGIRRDMVMAKWATGGALMGMAAYIHSTGNLVGGGDKQQQSEKLGGKMQYSIGGEQTYYGFGRMDPYGAFFGLTADFADIAGHLDDPERDSVASSIALALSRNLSSKTYLQNIAVMLKAIDGKDEKAMDNFVNNFAGSTVPSYLNAIRKETDPHIKEAWTIMDSIKARIPGLSKDVPNQLNVFGEDVPMRGGVGPDFISPLITSNKSTQPAAMEISRLNLDIRNPPRSIGGGNGPGIDLTVHQYHRYMQLIGGEFKAPVIELVNSKDYKSLPEDPTHTKYINAKEKSITLRYEMAKKSALQKLLEEDKGLAKNFEINQQNKEDVFDGKKPKPFLK